MKNLAALLVALLAVFAMTAAAADIAGIWKAVVDTPNGAMESTLDLKVQGTKLTGTVASAQMPATPISDGKVDGDNLSFVVKRDGPNGQFVINYKGTVSGDD
ncbi:MAG TPA: hypothetical protein VKE70_15635, partial [Candidatus Solibacter sp.]|nr:hypothetical protein [Candidatus Solibacter sp.]